jgi:hypothetical protein
MASIAEPVRMSCAALANSPVSGLPSGSELPDDSAYQASAERWYTRIDSFIPRSKLEVFFAPFFLLLTSDLRRAKIWNNVPHIEKRIISRIPPDLSPHIFCKAGLNA